MTRPLTIFLELVGGFTLIYGIATANLMATIIGGLMFVFGWIGTRERMRDDHK